MRLLQLVASEGVRCDGPIRLRTLREWAELAFSEPKSHMQQTSTSPAGSAERSQGVAETVVVLTIKHKGQLPADLLEKLTKRAYDCAAMHGMQPEVTAKEWYSLSVREA